MNRFNVNTKRYSLFRKAIMALVLPVAFMGFDLKCFWRRGGAAGHAVTKMTDDEFCTTMQNIKDIRDWEDQKKRSYLHATIKYGELQKFKKIIEALEQYLKQGQQELEKTKAFLNKPDPDSGNTPLAQIIVKDLAKNKYFFKRENWVEMLKVFLEKPWIDLIDFNKESNGRTPLLLAFKHKQKEMARALLDRATINKINIQVKGPTSRNTLLHSAIKNKWEDKDIAVKLINLLNKEATNLLFETNNDNDTPLHFAMEYKMATVQAKLISLLPEEKLFLQNCTKQTPLHIAIKNNQHAHIKELINKASVKNLQITDQNDETILHIAARLKAKGVLENILKQINKLLNNNNNKDTIVTDFFGKPQKGKSIWACIILSKLGAQPIFRKVNLDLFKHAIQLVKVNLKKNNWEDILCDISDLRNKNCLYGISEEYATELRNIVSKERN